ncbi:hypothetical protein LPMP_331540 [Leishmania panamensis]|uniref:RNA-binding protein, putative n=4 Tax=Viannia TaxID=37616 RepID=A0A088RZR0_LEIPA|nr:hypothetical protein LPMP_331540 [Leishmania panamensis]AIO01446.1 hypothetical protein LPMP_331540 [Leishmania panamensis]CCM18605.1 hypothetical protein, conserved [Leishmania guyanensis]
MAQLFVGQLPFSKFFPEDLLDLFRPYGSVIAHQLHIHQGNAFVTYVTTDEADRAIQALHSKCALGTRSQPIQVMYSKGTRLISAFGLHHRSVCLARNKDRQRSKEASTTTGSATDDDVLLNKSINTLGNSSSSKNVILTPLMCTAGGTGGNEEPNASFTTLFSSYGDLSGKSEISGEEDGRQPSGMHVALASSNLFLQQQKPPSYPVGADPLMYSSAMGWQLAHQSLVASTATTPLTSVISNGATTPMSDLINTSASTPTPVTYVMMPNSGNPMPCVMPLYYALPASTTSAIAQQHRQQQALASALASYNARTAPVQIAYLPIAPQ